MVLQSEPGIIHEKALVLVNLAVQNSDYLIDELKLLADVRAGQMYSEK